ncbi:hypothetical protein ACMA1I_00820 [Pontibacter sp. 13R65]|uniref:hypothetical protein n=1 Tax=Pontibacter sp. 13R65 TaxID=3127458 RepID=UPI00301BF3CE
MPNRNYTYQDWVEGKIQYHNFTVFTIIEGFAEEDLHKILTEQTIAYLKGLSNAFETIKTNFKGHYEESLLKENYLNEYIQNLERILELIKVNHDIIITQALNTMQDGRFGLTKAEVDKFNSSEVFDKQMQILLVNFEHVFDEEEPELEEEDKAPFMYILRANFYKWLLWFREQESLVKYEPGVNLQSGGDVLNYTVKKLLGDKKTYEWQGKPEEPITLYSLLIKDGYLPAETDLKNFKALFSGKNINSIEPLQWLKNKNLLAYLIDQLYDMGKLPDDTNYWSIAEACFIHTKNLKQQRINYQNNKQGKPKGYSKIDALLKQFTSTLPVNPQ